MKKFGITLLTTGLLAFSVCTAFAEAATTYPDTTVNPQLSGFTSVKIGGPFEVHISQGATESVKYIAPTDLVTDIRVEVDHGVLKVSRKMNDMWWSLSKWKKWDAKWNNRETIKVYIVATDLSTLTMSGSGQAILETPFSGNSLTVYSRGSGSVDGKIKVKFFEGRVSGSGSIHLAGNAETSAVRVSGSGHFTGTQLITGVSSVLVSGSGHAEVNAAEKIDATVHGSGSISYTGSPKSVSRKTSGSGEIAGS